MTGPAGYRVFAATGRCAGGSTRLVLIVGLLLFTFPFTGVVYGQETQETGDQEAGEQADEPPQEPADELPDDDIVEGEDTRVAGGDWGMTVDAFRSLRAAGHQDQDARTSALSATLWGQGVLPAGELSTIDLSIQGSFNWSTGLTYVDLDLARVRGRHPELFGASSVVETTVGRFRFQDPSALVFNHTADGASVQLGYPAVRLRLGAAYTGLLLNPVSSVRMTGIDLSEEDDEDELFGPERVVGHAELTFPEVIAGQTIVTGTVGQLDMRDPDGGEQTVNSGYALLGVRGPLLGNLYHDIYGVGSMGTREQNSDSEDYLGYLGSARLRLFLPKLAASRISVRGIYASRADSDPDDLAGGGDGYLPIARTRLGTVISLPLQNLLFGELSYSLRPFSDSESDSARRFQVRVAGRAFFTTSNRPVVIDPATDTLDNGDVIGIDDDPNGNFIGTEALLRLNMRVLSDLGLGATVGMFFPDTGDTGVFTDDRAPQFLTRLELSTRF